MADTPPNSNPPANTPPPGPGAITPEQLHQAIEKARLEEREKLRNQLNTAEEQVKTLKAEVESTKSQLTDTLNKVTKLTTDYETLKNSIKPDGQVDVEAAISRAVKATSDKLAADYGAQLSSLRSELESERTTRTRLSLDQRRMQMIQEAGGDSALIPELVTGSNEQELSASIERSKQVYQRTVAKVGGTPPSPTPPNSHGSGANVPPGAPPTVPLPASTTPPGAPAPAAPGGSKIMDMKEYAANRNQLRKQVAARYPTNVITQ